MVEYVSYEKLLSFWIFIYSFGYINNIFIYNPIILLFISYLFVIASSILIAYNYNKNTELFYFILVNSVIKLPFIFLLRNKKITFIDIIFTFLFILSYVIYMNIIEEDTVSYYMNIIKHIINNKDNGLETPLFSLYKYNML